MTTQLTVFADDAAAAAGRIAEAVASLPVSLHPGSAPADLVGIAGAPGWPRAAAEAIRAGVRGVLVADPVPEDVTELQALLQEQSIPLVIDGPWTYNPAVADSADAFAERNDAEGLIETRVDMAVGSDLDRVLLGQLALVRAAVGPVVELRFDRRNRNGYDAIGTLSSGARVSLAAILTNAADQSASVRLLKARNAARLSVPDAATAAPGSVVITTEEGATLLVTKWESAHRAAWRALHELVTSGSTGTDLADFAEDVATASRAGLAGA
ncbi:MAG: hypothetical protein QOE37_1918 [Microbacteriaceae bacterium]|nr:hypothetical protein [Microbacteriaceae bacterium]